MVMLSVICAVSCVVLAMQATIGLCLPTERSSDIKIDSGETLQWFNYPEDDTKPEQDKIDESFHVVLLESPNHVLKVEVVDEAGNANLQQLEIDAEDDITTIKRIPKSATETPLPPKRPSTRDVDYKTEREVQSYQCNWRKLYKLYLKKRRVQSDGFSKSKRNEIRRAFRIVCENPEEAIKILLDIV